jgi:serine/threonine protein kinase
MLEFTCSGCSQRLRVAENVAGRKVKCPRCGTILDAPHSPGSSLSDEKTQPPSVAEPPGLLRAPSSTIDPEIARLLAPAEQPDEIGRLGSYRVLKVLGVGGMGVVFEAEHLQLKRPAALKAMLPALLANPSCRQRFTQEAQSAARAGAIHNDHIVTVYEVGEANGVPLIAMQLLHGESLDIRLQRVKRLPVADVLRIGREIADGLDAAHQRGLIHRDIKPSNIWLEAGRDRVKILDFGLARAVGESHLTKSGVLIGTPSYMAPEQARGGHEAGPRSDLFSLGCVLYRACTGELPFKGTDTLATLTALATVEPPRVEKLNPEVPDELANLVVRLLAKNPAGRPSSARSVVDAICRIESGPGLESDGLEQVDSSASMETDSDTVALQLPIRPGRRTWMLAIACDLIALAMLISGLVMLARALRE